MLIFKVLKLKNRTFFPFWGKCHICSLDMWCTPSVLWHIFATCDLPGMCLLRFVPHWKRSKRKWVRRQLYNVIHRHWIQGHVVQASKIQFVTGGIKLSSWRPVCRILKTTHTFKPQQARPKGFNLVHKSRHGLHRFWRRVGLDCCISGSLVVNPGHNLSFLQVTSICIPHGNKNK